MAAPGSRSAHSQARRAASGRGYDGNILVSGSVLPVSEHSNRQLPERQPRTSRAAGTPAAAAATEVRRAVIGLARRLRQEHHEASLTALALSVLGHLHRRGPLTPGDLAGAERVQPQSLTRRLAALEASSLVIRQPDPADGRRSLLAITESGQSALRAEMEQRDAWLASAMAEQLTVTEIELLRLAASLLERLADAPNP